MAVRINITSPAGSDFFDTTFDKLMLSRVERVLLVCSKYDTFILEEDGRIDDQLFHEYASLKLRNPPQFVYARTSFTALDSVRNSKVDLVILMDSGAGMSSEELATRIKSEKPGIPIVYLTPFLRQKAFDSPHLSKDILFDYQFQWLGQADILLAIVKLIEDKMNASHDIHEVGAQAILLVEDSLHFTSIYLPVIYKLIFKQSLRFMSAGLNEHQQMLRLRGRPKVLLAKTFEEALVSYERYKHNLLGVISDIEFEREGSLDPRAGFHLQDKIGSDSPLLPFILQSSDQANLTEAAELKIGFVDKNADDLSRVIESYCFDHLAFGDFIFRNPVNGEELDRASDLSELQRKVLSVPDDSLGWHLSRNDISRWLKANALFILAGHFQFVHISDLPSLDAARNYISDTISAFRMYELRGKVAHFDRKNFDEYFLFTRIGNGSLGGKARGLAFLDEMLKEQGGSMFPSTVVRIPRTLVLSTEVFDEFMIANDLDRIGNADISDAKKLSAFVKAKLPKEVSEDLRTFASVVKAPLAVRSSSLLEDSLHQPFAGIYSTYMLPYPVSPAQALTNIEWAVKAVFASTFFQPAKSYMSATSIKSGEEKMAVILQEAVGSLHGTHFYPSLSGVARSLNFYPVGVEKAAEGVALVAIGLGRYVVSGGISLRFSPAHPKNVMQLTSPLKALNDTQKTFLALKTDLLDMRVCKDETDNIETVPIQQADVQLLRKVASTFDAQSQRLSDSTTAEGAKVITFSRILNYDSVPLPAILQHYLKSLLEAFNHPVELEFAMEFASAAGHPDTFYLLQVRPMLVDKEKAQQEEIPDSASLLAFSRTVLGNGQRNDISNIVYVKPESFDSLRTQEMAVSLDAINTKLRLAGIRYVLAAPGRWGSSDPNLGIPVQWQQISNACLLIETHLEKYRIEPSQGTHFFHNLTTMNVGYFSVTPYHDDSFMNFEALAGMETVYEDKYIRHVRASAPLKISMNARDGVGFIALS